MQSPYNLIPSLPPYIFKSHLNILPNYNAETEPLRRMWNRSQQEFFEIEILRDENERMDLPFEKSMDDILNLNKYTCHICNIEVPKLYMKEHNRSNKHETCTKITNLALERTKLQMQLDIVVSRRIEVTDTYFCGPCSIVVFVSEKEKHENNKLHKISLKHDELLNELLKIYLDRDNVEIKSDIDELKWLKQKTNLDTMKEGSELINAETDSLNNANDVKEIDSNILTEVYEVSNVLQPDIPSTVEIMESAVLQESCNDVMSENEKHADNINAQKPVKAQSSSKNRALKKRRNRKAKERFHSICQDLAVVRNKSVISDDNNTSADLILSPTIQVKETIFFEKNNNVLVLEGKEALTYESTSDILKLDCEKAIISEYNNDIKILEEEKAVVTENIVKDLDISSAISVKGAKHPLIVDIDKNIDVILTKYFDKNHTVDALNNIADREHKIIKEPKKTKDDRKKIFKKTQNEKKNEQNIENIKQNLDENELNVLQSIKQTVNKDISIHSQVHNEAKNEHNINTDTKEQNKTTELKLNYNETSNKKKIKRENNVDYKENKGDINQASKPEKSQAPSFNLLYYLKDTAWRCQTKPIHTAEAISDTIIQITAINGDKIKILVNNFHSFHAKSQEIYCKICERPNVRRPEWHIIEGEHRAKVMIPIQDKNGIRQLDDIWSHCIVCNDLTRNLDFHLQSLLHRNKLRHCLIELGNSTYSDDDFHTSPCVKKPFKNSRSEDKTPVKDVLKKYCKDGAKIAALMFKNNLVMTSKNYLNCVICNVIVNYDLITVKQHVDSFDHLTNIEREQNKNRLIDIDGKRLYCIVCDVNISSDEIFSHCNGKKHKKALMEELNNQDEMVATEQNEVVLPSISQNVKKLSKDTLENGELICFVCDTILYCIDEHMDSFEHKKSYYAYLEANKLNEIEPDTFYCIPCNTVITIDYLMSHCHSRTHKLTLKNYTHDGSTENLRENTAQAPSTSLTSTEITWVVTPTLDVNEKTMPLKVLYQFREMNEPSKLLCTVCFEEVTYTRKEAEYHISMLDHVVAFNLMMLWNKIKKRDDKYFCDICRIDMTYFSEITHVLGKQHAQNVAKEPKGTVYEYDRTLVTHAYAMSHKVGDRTKPSSVVSVSKTIRDASGTDEVESS